MGSRLLMLIRRPGTGPEQFAEVRRRIARLPAALSIEDDGAILCAASGKPPLRFANGFIVGALFDRRFPRRGASLDAAECQQITQSRGQRLIDGYWGSYVAAFAHADGAAHVVRAPFGELPCYWLESDRIVALASDPDLLVAAGLMRTSLNWDAMARELAWGDLRGDETCLEGLTALRGGERLSIDAQGTRVDPLWSPWRFAAAGSEQSATSDAEIVRRTAQNCVAARASEYAHVLLLLSGGLDSSIVAACLSASRTPFSLVTLTTRDPLGDELDYGRCVAEAVRQPLHEALREVSEIDPDRSTAARLPRPAGRLFEQETARIVRATGIPAGAQAVFGGGGGDNVFCSLRSAAPAADRLLTIGPGRAFLGTARAVSDLAPASLVRVIWAAIGRTLPGTRRSPAYCDPSFLSEEARAAVRAAVPHPWLSPPRGALPGKAAHIKLLAYAESFQQGFDPQADLPMVTPLLSQPLVETCLAIPSWEWVAEGRNRAVARRAFAADLPARIISRRSKGTPDSFAAEIYERYRPKLRERVLGGLLAQHHLIDVTAARQAFDRSGSLAPENYRRLLRVADVESWARIWAGKRAS